MSKMHTVPFVIRRRQPGDDDGPRHTLRLCLVLSPRPFRRLAAMAKAAGMTPSRYLTKEVDYFYFDPNKLRFSSQVDTCVDILAYVFPPEVLSDYGDARTLSELHALLEQDLDALGEEEGFVATPAERESLRLAIAAAWRLDVDQAKRLVRGFARRLNAWSR